MLHMMANLSSDVWPIKKENFVKNKLSFCIGSREQFEYHINNKGNICVCRQEDHMEKGRPAEGRQKGR